MITLITILAICLFMLLAFLVCVIVGGTSGLLIAADVVVCIAVIGFIIKIFIDR